MNVEAATVLICTYNRAPLLRESLDAILTSPRRDDYAAEVLVVDNNSTDDTRRVVEEASRTATLPLRYLFEPRQGKSYALNLGLAEARGDIIAHTDDDVIPGEGWLDRIVRAFRTEDITFAFGKVLPRWGTTPPPELLLPRARDIWGPLALLDHGDEPQRYDEATRRKAVPVGANLGLDRRSLLEVGGWRTDLGKVDNSLISGEDHEIFHRLTLAGRYRGLYDPQIVVRHYVPASRLTRRYFRRWFYWHGKTMARMAPAVYEQDFSTVPHVLGVPRFMYRQAAGHLWKWVGKTGRRDALGLLIEELRSIECLGFMAECWNRGGVTAQDADRR